MPVVSIRHLTTYRYRNPVSFGEHRMMFRPLEAFDQRVLSAELEISPEPGLFRHVHDAGGASVGVVRFDRRSDRLSFESRILLEHAPHGGFDLEAEGAVLRDGTPLYDGHEMAELARSLTRWRPDRGEVAAWARSFLRPVGPTRVSEALTEMTHAIREGFAYRLRLSGAPQTPVETLESRTGSCRDFAVLMMEAARSLGVAARFVSGYVYSTSPKGRTGGGHTHAWIRAYVPGCGWIDFDPTNGIIGGADLIRVAVAADPREALPLHGTWTGEAGDYLGMDVEVAISTPPAVAAKLQAVSGVALAR
ncbi:transglutaminase family protein [Phenylobacterium sp. J426]|uniref:transglutaminase family protein n=1 Tax=Phenylobacterium sp. J426 TaxID=2898439 RepID=UPI0021513E40|nr:transglutaminase family protein [Phenylobacterium sp. J426]MCR5875213.1 transglutaminase family protein [Phenylobacterium sp. J426]